MKDIFLLIGQCSMAGRGLPEEVANLEHRQVQMFRDDSWTIATEPLHTDKPGRAGVGLAMSFAVELLDRNQATAIGLIPCAVGGTPLNRWMPEADLFEHAVCCNSKSDNPRISERHIVASG
jgi:hypothetical protein